MKKNDYNEDNKMKDKKNFYIIKYKKMSYEDYLNDLGYDPELELEAQQLACYEDEQREDFDRKEMEYEVAKHYSWLSEEERQQQQYEARQQLVKENFLPF